jgi:phage terminase small subunit
MRAELTEKESRFCEEYPIDFNATQAAIRAGYSEKTAGAIGHENLKKPKIQAKLSEVIQKTGEQLGITRERVMQEIGRLAFVDIRKAFTIDGALKPITEMDDETAAALAGLEVYEEKVSDPGADETVVAGQTKKIKLYDKTKALEMLAKHFKIYTDAPVNNNSIRFGYGPEQPV